MTRPSRNTDRALLQSGRVLYPQHGCAGLSLRMLAEHAQVNLGMFHYHFQSKNIFLSRLLTEMYDDLFEQLEHDAQSGERALVRLRAVMCHIARLLQENGHWLGRVIADASAGELVAKEFIRSNGSRHVALLMQLATQVESDGDFKPMPMPQRLAFLMGSVVAPMIVVPNALRWVDLDATFQTSVQTAVLSDEAIAQRVELALQALCLPERCDKELK